MTTRRDLGLAAITWKLVEDYDPDPKCREELRARALGLGPMLLGSGLAATTAFLQAKAHGTDGLARAYRATLDGLTRHVLQALGEVPDGDVDLVRWLADKDDHASYRRAGAAAGDFALWLRRAAGALIPAPGPS